MDSNVYSDCSGASSLRQWLHAFLSWGGSWISVDSYWNSVACYTNYYQPFCGFCGSLSLNADTGGAGGILGLLCGEV